MSLLGSDVEIVRIAGGPIEVEILPGIGARLHRLRAFGVDVLRAPDDPRIHRADPWFWGSYVMAPWCNRVAPGPATIAGRAMDLAPNFFDGSAIHGQVLARPWRDEGAGVFRVTGGADGTGWPWAYDVEHRVTIEDSRLSLALRLTNLSAGPMPGGLGFHPWFMRPVRVAIAASGVLPSNVDSPPEPLPVSGVLDRRRLAALPDGLDATWTNLAEPPVVLAWPAAGITATMTVESPSLCIVAASPADKDAVAVEPQTHGPDGIRRLVRGEPFGLALMPPGGSIGLTMRLAFARSDGDLGEGSET